MYVIILSRGVSYKHAIIHEYEEISVLLGHSLVCFDYISCYIDIKLNNLF